VLVSVLLGFNACRERPAVQASSVGPSASSATGRGRVGMTRIPGWLARDDGQWLHPAKDYANTRFSSLDQIDVGNAANLRLAFTFSTGLSKGHEAAPIVVGTTMYIVTPYPNYLYALRLEKAAATLKWTYKPNPDPA